MAGWMTALRSPVLIPCLLIAVAVCQILMAQFRGLSSWKGGGFGMFATLDAPTHRYLWLQATDVYGKHYEVSLPSGPSSGPEFTPSQVLRTITAPTRHRLEAIASAVLRSRVVRPSSDPRVLPRRLAESVHKEVLEAVARRQDVVEVVPNASAADKDEVVLTEVSAQVLRVHVNGSPDRLQLAGVGPIVSVRREAWASSNPRTAGVAGAAAERAAPRTR